MHGLHLESVGPPSNEHPNQHDYDQLASIYSHLDSTTTVASSPAPGAFSTPGEWGRLVAGSHAAHSVALYERDLGAGQKLLTFVVWA